MTYLVDTHWVASYLNGRQDAIQLLNTLAQSGIAISLIMYGEIYDGIYHGRTPRAAERGFLQFLQIAPVLPLNKSIMKRFARIRGDLRIVGRVFADADIMIAATAIHHGLTLVSRNTRHFSRIPSLQIYQHP